MSDDALALARQCLIQAEMPATVFERDVVVVLARAVIEAVPREPTDNMYRAGQRFIADAVDVDQMPSAFIVWMSMYAAYRREG